MALDDLAPHFRRGPAPGDARRRSRPWTPTDPAADRLHLGDDRRAARRRLPTALPGSGSASRQSTGSAPAPAEVAWCTTAPGWSKSTRNVFVAPWLSGAVAVLHDGRFDPAERLRLCEELGVNVLCQAPTEYRMLAKRAELAPIRALRRLVSAGEPLEPEVIRRLPGAARAADRRRLRADRDRAGKRHAPRRGRPGPRRLDGKAATRDRDADPRRRASAAGRLLPHLLRPLPRRRALRGRVVADRRPGARGRGRLSLLRGTRATT